MGLAAAADAATGGTQQKFAVLAGETDTVPNGCLRLAWPIRLENLLSLLWTVGRKVEKETRGISKATALPAQREGLGSDLIRFASLLRAGGGSAGTYWRVEGVSKRPLHVSPAEQSFFFGESLMLLRNLNPNTRLEFIPVPKEEFTLHVGRKPLVMLRWLVGLQTGALGLLPWIDGTQTMRLSRYPEFQMLHHQAAHRRIAAALSRPRRGVEVIAEITNEDVATVVGFVNAVSLCGYLLSLGESAEAPKTVLSETRRSLFKSFRKALGIISANA
jgi:hypothetical protein